MYKKILLLAILIVPFFSACGDQSKDDLPNGVWVRFKNETGAPIEDAIMNLNGHPSVRIGQIAANRSSDYIYFNVFPTVTYDSNDRGYPGGALTGKIQGEDTYFSTGFFCGTGLMSSALPDGDYVIRLIKNVNQGYTYYRFEFE